MTFVRKHKGNSFVKTISMVVGGTAFAQILTILVSPILTRLYTPEQFGVYSAFMSVVNMLSISASLDIQNAIPLEKDRKNALHLLFTSVIVLIIVSLSFAVVFTFGDQLFYLLSKSESLNRYRYWVVIGIFTMGIYNIGMQYAFKDENFKDITITKYSQSIIGNGFKVISGIISNSSFGLLIGTILSQSVGTSRLFRKPIKDIKNTNYRFNYNESKKLIHHYRKFPLFSAPNNYVYTISTQLPALMVIRIYGESISGNYSLANTIINLPAVFLGTAIGQVFYARIARYGKDDPDRLVSESKSILRKMIVIGGAIFGAAFLLAPYLIPFIFGVKWKITSQFVQILSVNAFSSFIIQPIGRGLEIVNQQQIALYFNLLRLGLIFIIFIYAEEKSLNVVKTLWIYSIVSGIIYILCILNIFLQMKKYSISRKDEKEND